MPKTKTLEIITSDEARVKNYRNKTKVIVEDPEIDDMLSGMASEDIISWLNDQGFSPDEVFADEDLQKWAEEHGYVKDGLKDTAVGPIPVSETA